MKIVLQRVLKATIKIDNKTHSTIEKGLLILLGIHETDTIKDVKYLAKKTVRLRIFEDKHKKMNLSIIDLDFSIMLVSQFTLYGNLKRGNRPSFVHAAKPTHAKPLYELFVNELKKYNIKIKTGKFGEKMLVELTNDGPVTFILES